MAGLGQTVAELMARAGARAAAGGGVLLKPVTDFGSNPGGLRMGLYAPIDLPPSAPLVVVLHGCGQTAGGYAAGAGWIELADRQGFAVLCPEQVRSNNANLCFNWFEDGDSRRGAGEAESIAQMVRRAMAELDLDEGRVFVTGLSAGGAMAAVMLAAYPELFAAGAVIAGLPYGAASGVAEALGAMRREPALSDRAWGDKVRAAAPAGPRWPRVAVWRGEADRTVAPGAGEALARQWCDVHGATEIDDAPCRSSRHVRRAWEDANGVVVVELHTIAGLGHGTPIAAGGADGCGSPGPWILEAGISSSHEIARSWGLDRPGRPRPARRPRLEPVGAGTTASAAAVPPMIDVGATITRALRSARLLR